MFKETSYAKDCYTRNPIGQMGKTKHLIMVWCREFPPMRFLSYGFGNLPGKPNIVQ
jgi:hypothetical protein